MDRLGFLLAGGLLTALTTRLTGGEPLPVTAPPNEPLAVREADVDPAHLPRLGGLS